MSTDQLKQKTKKPDDIDRLMELAKEFDRRDRVKNIQYQIDNPKKL